MDNRTRISRVREVVPQAAQQNARSTQVLIHVEPDDRRAWLGHAA